MMRYRDTTRYRDRGSKSNDLTFAFTFAEQEFTFSGQTFTFGAQQ